ncbi:MAG TPA: rhomboid family intramembrane serine protease [Gemmatimonadales bacterium]|jgi:membrane associated rhomboid family serine protease|nr:rhomboid family intramembrane serine protease [Gemmatimonadales bacterium]
MMTEDSLSPQRMYVLTPWVRRLLVANLIVFLFQVTLFTLQGSIKTFGFIPLDAARHPWTFLTYMFLHGSTLHLAFNLLALFMFGGPVEDRFGSRSFIGFYLLCGMGGALLSLLLVQGFAIRAPIVGASGAIYGVLVAFAWHWPDAPIYMFPLPVPIPAKWLVTFAFAVSLLLALPPFSGGGGVAHLAHLGGMVAGFLYLKAQDMRLGRAERHLRRVSEPSVLVTPVPRGRTVRGRGGSAPQTKPHADSPPDARAHAEIDRVLDKISAAGIESLTPAERKFLVEMSRHLRTKP